MFYMLQQGGVRVLIITQGVGERLVLLYVLECKLSQTFVINVSLRVVN